MYWWRFFDPAEVSRDFARVRTAGFDSVRIFLLWEDFQPDPQRISRQCLRDLKTVVTIAADEALDLIVTFFTGHMSGANWIPAWAVQPISNPQRFRVVAGGQVVSAEPRNWYTDPEIIAAQIRLVTEVGDTLSGNKSVWAWDLGNENSNCVVPATHALAAEWLQRITGALRECDATRPITIGLHMEDLEEDRKLGPSEAARFCDFLCMHGYPIYANWSRSATDANLLPFLGLMTQWLGGREVLFEEFGAPAVPSSSDLGSPGSTILLSDYEAASYTADALGQLYSQGFMGGFVWCYSDYSPSLWGLPPLDQAVHERYFGLWRSDGAQKPAVSAIERFAGLSRKLVASDFSWIDIEQSEYYQAPRLNLQRLYKKFCLTFDPQP